MQHTTSVMPKLTGRQEAAPAAEDEEEEARDWAGLPLDVILAVLHRLDHIDILMAAERVCSSWRRAARDEPQLWRRIVMRGNAELSTRLHRHGMACAAVRRSAGQCEAFCGERAADDGFLLYLSEQAPKLKSLRLISCGEVSKEGFVDLIKEFPLLEELELSQCHNLHDGVYHNRHADRLADEVYVTVHEACPHLKHFRLSKKQFVEWEWMNNDADAEGVSALHELRTLELFANTLTNQGLATILDNCRHLEYLDIRHCFNIDIGSDGALRGKCTRIRTVRLPHDSTHDYDLEFESPSFICRDLPASPPPARRKTRTPHYYLEEEDSDGDDYGGPSRYEDDLDKYDKMLPRSMRTFLR